MRVSASGEAPGTPEKQGDGKGQQPGRAAAARSQHSAGAARLGLLVGAAAAAAAAATAAALGELCRRQWCAADSAVQSANCLTSGCAPAWS